MSNTKPVKIFISHSSADANVGEKFLDALVSLGINKEEVFYSSLYFTGVALGENFHSYIKKALSESELVIFLLTSNLNISMETNAPTIAVNSPFASRYLASIIGIQPEP